MHPFSVLTLAIFVAGYITARWDLVTRLHVLAIFAWDKGVIVRAAQAFVFLSFAFLVVFIPVHYIAQVETNLLIDYLIAPAIAHPWNIRSRTTQAQGLLLAGVLWCRPVMPEHDGLMRVFWPIDIERSHIPGVIVGWRNSSLDVVVVAVLDHVDPTSVENALKTGILLRNAPHEVPRIFELCGLPSLHVLGLTNHEPNFDHDPSWVQATTGPSQRIPKISCLGASSIQIILFERPIPLRMQYISLDPITLSLDDKEDHSSYHASDSSEAEDEKQERIAKRKKRYLVQKFRQHSVVAHAPSPKDRALPRIVNQINWARELEQLLQKNVSLIGTRPKRVLSVSEQVVERATNMRDYVILWIWDMIIHYVFPIVRAGFIILLLCHRFVAEGLLRVLEWRARPNSPALKDVSATAQQVEIRLQQFCYWPMQYVKLRLRKNDWESVTTSHPDYIRFYNSLWLVANDIIIGIALGSYIIDNADWVADTISMVLGKYTINALQSSISWLMGWPAGLKLNSELALFLGDLFLWVIDYWSSCIATLQPLLPHIVMFIGFSSFGGASMPIALFSDLLSMLTMHIYSFYLASARIFHWQLTILLSLFQLFQGKKYNVLRNRVDSCDYDLDQLLVGTILFTLLSFLLPTVVVFYLNFALARGIRFELYDTHDRLSVNSKPSTPPSSPQPTSVICLKPTPLAFTAMFHQYFQMGSRIRKHYLSPRVLFCLMTGRFVPPIHRKNLYSLQYSMLPARRAGIMEMWEALNSLPAKERPLKAYPYVLGGAMPNGGRNLNGRAAREGKGAAGTPRYVHTYVSQRGIGREWMAGQDEAGEDGEPLH
ncbi:Gpi1-domain-containing protein [Xylariaceae sp. FL0662B]|nr:Gpi1-domain-containing protein [Xylariaceae sp. FL0662B]